MAVTVFSFKLPGRLVAQGGVQVVLIVRWDPGVQGTDQGKGTGPFLEPEAFFFERAHQALGVGIALGIVVAGKGLLDPQGATGIHEGARRRLTAVVTHEGQSLLPGPIGKLSVDRHVQRGQPILGFAWHAGIVADDLLGIPIEHDDDIDPAEAAHQDLGHINAPPFVRPGWPRFAPGGRPRGFQSPVGLD